MPIHLAVALSSVLLATAATSPNITDARQKFEGEVSDWQYALGHEDGIVIEHRGSRGVSRALFIRLGPGNVQVGNTVSTSGATGEGRFNSRSLVDLIKRSEPFDGYRYRCKCFDADSVDIIIARWGKTTRLYAYGPLEGVKGPAASVIRAWEMTGDKVADNR